MQDPKSAKPGKSGKTTKGGPATAAGQALGYGLQYTRLTAMLLNAPPGAVCSLEVLDDVAQTTSSGTTTLVQSKSALTGNPVADRAVPFWKALFNWFQIVKASLVAPQSTIFELYISREVSGSLVSAFHSAQTETQAKDALHQARVQLWGASPKFLEKFGLPEELSRYANPFLEADDNFVLPIVMNMRLVCGSGSPQGDIEAAIRRGPVSEARVFDIADKMCGWVKRTIDKKLEEKLPALISYEDFHREYVAFVRSVDRDIMLKSLARKPSEAEKLERVLDLFVQQLDLIEMTFDEKLAAISDFLTASRDRAIWSKAGDVHEDAFVELDASLTRTWSNLRKATELEASSQSDVKRGQLLHLRCMLHSAKVQGMEVPAHFVPGCFHGLADEIVVGWHPAFLKLIKKLAITS